MLWDHCFGTYEAETEKPEFGIVTPINTRNPILINTRPFARMFGIFRQQRTMRRKWLSIFGAPGAL